MTPSLVLVMGVEDAVGIIVENRLAARQPAAACFLGLLAAVESSFSILESQP
ncbi:hypothetical protein ACQKH5_01610 [Hyphomonas sp. NPDC076900]|uniref:hypothetical protein n=1 Tax=unclassified Hyphomonas TaxID=2630699 RepID=UPI003D064A7D